MKHKIFCISIATILLTGCAIMSPSIAQTNRQVRPPLGTSSSSVAVSRETNDEVEAVVKTQEFYILGFGCEIAGCGEPPNRKLGAPLRFDATHATEVLNRAKRLDHEWGIMLKCAVVGLRLKKCTPDNEGHAVRDISAAKTIAQALRLRRNASLPPYAHLTVQYSNAFCPSWQCTITPAPPHVP